MSSRLSQARRHFANIAEQERLNFAEDCQRAAARTPEENLRIAFEMSHFLGQPSPPDDTSRVLPVAVWRTLKHR